MKKILPIIVILVLLIEKYKNSCKTEKISDSIFNIPTDIQFEDRNKIQGQMMKQIPKVLSGENQEEMQKYVQDMIKQQWMVIIPPNIFAKEKWEIISSYSSFSRQ